MSPIQLASQSLGTSRRTACRFAWVASMSLVLFSSGCATTWDDITSREFRFKNLFKKADPPLVVLEKSTDGDKRAKAFAALKEPLANGGTSEDQDKVIDLLSKGATIDPQALCRLRAVETVGRFKDERAVEILKEAYYRAGSFGPEIATLIKCQAMTSLGVHGDPKGMDLLTKVLREPTVVGSEMDKQSKLDEKIVAARTLSQFKESSFSTESLLNVLKTEKDVALRNAARESLVKITKKDLPADFDSWDTALHDANAFKEAPNKSILTDVAKSLERLKP